MSHFSTNVQTFLAPLVLAALFATTGCAGARTQVVAPTATVPVSLSRAVRDADGTIVPAERREILGELDAEGTAWGLLYSGIKLTPEMDVSQAVNEEIARLHGDAVINVTIATSQCGLNYVPPLNLLPFWPGCAKIRIHGDIIRVHASAPPPSAAPSEAAMVAKTANAKSKGKTKEKRAHSAEAKLVSRNP